MDNIKCVISILPYMCKKSVYSPLLTPPQGFSNNQKPSVLKKKKHKKPSPALDSTVNLLLTIFVFNMNYINTSHYIYEAKLH